MAPFFFSIGKCWGVFPPPLLRPMSIVFTRSFRKHWLLFQPGLPLGFGIRDYSRMPRAVVLGGWGARNLGTSAYLLQRCSYSRAQLPGHAREGISVPGGGSSPKGAQEYALSGQTPEEEREKALGAGSQSKNLKLSAVRIALGSYAFCRGNILSWGTETAAGQALCL